MNYPAVSVAGSNACPEVARTNGNPGHWCAASNAINVNFASVFPMQYRAVPHGRQGRVYGYAILRDGSDLLVSCEARCF